MTIASPEVVLAAKVFAALGVTWFVLLAIFAIARILDPAHKEPSSRPEDVVSPAKLDELRARRHALEYV